MDERYRKKIDDLYQQMYPMLFEYARSSLSSDALAEEAIQDTFTVACQKAQALCESPNPRGWLVKTLKNVICNTRRTQKAAAQLLADLLAVDAEKLLSAKDRIDLDILYCDIADTEDFKLLKEMVIDGKSHLEMAQARNIHIEACRKRMQRAKKNLQKKIQR